MRISFGLETEVGSWPTHVLDTLHVYANESSLCPTAPCGKARKQAPNKRLSIRQKVEGAAHGLLSWCWSNSLLPLAVWQQQLQVLCHFFVSYKISHVAKSKMQTPVSRVNS